MEDAESVTLLEPEHEHVENMRYDNFKHNWKQIFLGILMGFLAGLTYTVQNALVADEEVNFYDVITCRYSLTTIVILIMVRCCNSSKLASYPDRAIKSQRTHVSALWIFEVDEGQNIHLLRGNLVLVGVFAFISVAANFSCVTYMPLGDASALIFSAPLPTILLSAVFLGTRLRLYKIFCGLLLYTGIILVVKPPILVSR